MNQKHYLLIGIVFFIVVGFFIFTLVTCTTDSCLIFKWQKAAVTHTFEECVAHGFPVTNSSPRQCQAGERVYTEKTTPSTDSKNIHVTEPRPNAVVGIPFTLRGDARVFENTFVYRIKDSDNSILLERSVLASSGLDGTEYGTFEITVHSYPMPKGIFGTLEIFDYSAKDGKEIDKISIPITFKKSDTATLSIFFPNSKFDPNHTDCTKNFSVSRRVAAGERKPEIALQELLLAPDRKEESQGYITSINPGVQVNSVSVLNGIAHVDFNDLLRAGVAGSCRVLGIRSQISDTLKQFSEIKEVVISVNGESEGILEP